MGLRRVLSHNQDPQEGQLWLTMLAVGRRGKQGEQVPIIDRPLRCRMSFPASQHLLPHPILSP